MQLSLAQLRSELNPASTVLLMGAGAAVPSGAPKQWRIAKHEEVFAGDDADQDLLWKFTLPATERIRVLRQLDDYNLNAFSLFQTEDALLETVALREIDFSR